jgi:hypothetical protein
VLNPARGITGLGLAGLITLAVDSPYWQLAFWQLVVGAGVVASVLGAVASLMRGEHRSFQSADADSRPALEREGAR